MDKIKILFVLPYIIQSNGVLSFCWEYLRYLPTDKFDISIISTDRENSISFLSFCHRNNIEITLLPSPKSHSVFTYIKSIKRFFKQHHNFDILHCNITIYGYFYLCQAKKYNIPVRILHSHSRTNSAIWWKNLIGNIIKPLVVKKANTLFACSKEAGTFLFGKKDFYIISNAIDENRFSFSLEKREIIRKKLGISNTDFVIGNVGRIAYQKNPLFIVDIFTEYLKNNPNSKLVMVGSGTMQKEVEEKVNQLNLNKRVIFTGSVPNPEDYYSSFDVFVMPSLIEGFGTASIEAQSASLPCLLSTNVSQSSKFKENVMFLSLCEDKVRWAAAINESLKLPNKEIPGKNLFNIVEQSKHLANLYISLLKKAKS